MIDKDSKWTHFTRVTSIGSKKNNIKAGRQLQDKIGKDTSGGKDKVTKQVSKLGRVKGKELVRQDPLERLSARKHSQGKALTREKNSFFFFSFSFF